MMEKGGHVLYTKEKKKGDGIRGSKSCMSGSMGNSHLARRRGELTRPIQVVQRGPKYSGRRVLKKEQFIVIINARLYWFYLLYVILVVEVVSLKIFWVLILNILFYSIHTCFPFFLH